MGYFADVKVDSDIGQLLLDASKLSKEALADAVKLSRSSDQSLIEVLKNKFNLDEDFLYETVSKSTGLAFRQVSGETVERSVISKVPIKIAWHYGFMPLRIEGSRLIIAVDYPYNLKTLDEIGWQLGLNVQQVLAKKRDIVDLLKKYYGFAADTVERIVSKTPAPSKNTETEISDVDKPDAMAGDASVINLVNEIILDAYQKRATDIHFEPYRGEFRLRYRIDGILQDVNFSQKARHLILHILSRIKIMANLDIVERRIPQDGRASVKISDQPLDLRISSIPTRYGESIVIRILPMQLVFDLSKLGLSTENLRTLRELIQKPSGIILLTGPTGSGKTTTLYASLQEINDSDTKIITIEDPVEYEIQGITQIQIQPKVGLDFAKGLRSMLRHDPDVMMVGEIRDYETAEIAIRAALTGHLVFSTLHTNDAASGVTRLLDIGLEPFLVASSLEAIVAQRLVRTICGHCKTEDTGVASSLKAKIAKDLRLKSPNEVKVFKGKGCDRCNHTGYFGRTAIHEILVVDEKTRDLIVKKASGQDIRADAAARGMTTLLQDGWKKVLAGATTPAEVINVANLDPAAAQSADEPDLPAPAGPGAKDKRTYPRISSQYNVSCPPITVEYRIFELDSEATDRQPLRTAYSENVSASGFLLKISELLPLGALLDVQFKLEGTAHNARRIRCLARVARMEETAEENYYLAGIMFLDLATPDRALINEFIRKHS